MFVPRSTALSLQRRPWLVLLVGLLGACSGTVDDDDTTEPPLGPGEFLYENEPVLCDSPAGSLPELSEESQSRGLLLLLPEGPAEGGEPPGEDDSPPPDNEDSVFGSGLANIAIVAQDIDADGDIDVVTSEARPALYLNDGTGHFTVSQVGPKAEGGLPVHMMAADLDGDGLPELIGSLRPMTPEGEHGLVIWPNLGDAVFDSPLYVSTGYAGMYGDSSTMAIGDINGDGWLDIHHGKRHQAPGLMGTHPEQIFLGSEQGFRSDRILELSAYKSPAGVVTLVSAFTDRDGDGDQDLFVLGGTPEWGTPTPGSAFFRNDGGETPQLVNDAEATGTGAFFSAMGIDSADLNSDGILDYCATDVGPPRCYLSINENLWFEGAVTSLGLLPADPVYDFPQTIGWSIDFRDMNNDGLLDILQASAPDHGGIWAGGDPFPDLLWLGQPDGLFTDVTASTGFGSSHDHVGMVSADFDGNGALDVLFHAENNNDIPRLYMNRCTEGHWTNIELVGPPQNSEGFGARLQFDYGKKTQIREVFGLRATAQTPSRVHQGLGDVATFDLTIHWPDGVVTSRTGLPVDRLITAVHPLGTALEGNHVGDDDTSDDDDASSDDDDASSDDDDSTSELGRLEGTITRSVEPALDGVGDIFMTISNPLLGSGPAGIVAEANFYSVDLSAPGSSFSYELDHIPITATPLNIELFLDDDGSGATSGPASQDLTVTTFPTALVDSQGGDVVHIVLDHLIP